MLRVFDTPNVRLRRYHTVWFIRQKRLFYRFCIWNYLVATTIGYGSITPSTNKGKLFCIVFVIIGIPYFAYMISIMAELINQAIRLGFTHNIFFRFFDAVFVQNLDLLFFSNDEFYIILKCINLEIVSIRVFLFLHLN